MTKTTSMLRNIATIFFLFCSCNLLAQKGNDVTTPLHAMKVDYPTPYTPPKIEAVKAVLDKVYHYLDAVTPAQLVHRKTGDAVTLSAVDTNTIVKPGDFRLTSYEWGVTYSGMLEAGAATGDKKFTDYTKSRTEFIVSSLPPFKKLYEQYG